MARIYNVCALMLIAAYSFPCYISAESIDYLAGDPVIPGVEHYELIGTPNLAHKISQAVRQRTVFPFHMGRFGTIRLDLYATDQRSSNTLHGLTFGTYAGLTDEGGMVRLTLASNFVYGYIEWREETYWIEPAWYYQDECHPSPQTVVYRSSDIKTDNDMMCGATELASRMQDLDEKVELLPDSRRSALCYQIDLAIASDYSMYVKYGSNPVNVMLHNIGVINNVNGNYTSEFIDDIEFVIVEQYVSDCPGCDPWSSTSDPVDLLLEFRDWAEIGGFHQEYQLGEMWTDRFLDGGISGIAIAHSICSSNKYHLLRDYTPIAEFKRKLVAHEIGHNFGATHDIVPGFIMSQGSNQSNSWSAGSKSTIDQKIVTLASSGCLEICGYAVPPVAMATVQTTSICPGDTVHYTDISTNQPDSWTWSFEGGVPATSTLQHPMVVYPTHGVFDVELITSNAQGYDTLFIHNLIFMPDTTHADFAYEHMNSTAIAFDNLSTFAADYLWDFGDSSTSNETNPYQIFEDIDEYTVTLIASNACAVNDTTQQVIDLSPCASELTVTGEVSSGGYYATNEMAVNAMTASGVSVSYGATNGVNVLAGSEVEAGAEVFIEAKVPAGCED